MKKIYIILMVVMLVLTMTLSAGATEHEETAIEITETETVLSTTLSTEAETSIIEADTELSGLLGDATPEQIETVKQYIMYGLNELPFPDQVRIFVQEHLEAFAWIFAGAMFLAYFIGNRLMKKSLSQTVTTTSNNAVEVAELAQACIDDAKKSMSGTAEAVERALKTSEEKSEAMLKEAQAVAEDAKKAIEDMSASVLKAVEDLKSRETGLTESEVLMATVLCDLVKNSALPQWKKDEFEIHLKEGMTRISAAVEVDEHDEV